jgi:CMP-N,N'-diacetyllegionaminic acid synthase
MRILSIIPARGGSKGIPKKNITNIAGKPLIAWTIEASLRSRFDVRTVVSSDDDEILNISKKLGAETVKRPRHLAKDSSPTVPVIAHVIEHLKKTKNYKPDIVLLLQPTSPLRDEHDIDEALELLLASGNASAIISVHELPHHPLKSFTSKKNGYLQGLVNNKYPFMPRQNLPRAFNPNGALYAIKAASFIRNKKLLTRKTLPFFMPLNKSIDIDTIDDINEAEKILKK